MKRILILSGILIMLLATPIVVSEQLGNVTIDYLANDLFIVQGNVTLVFNDSDTGTNDITLIRVFYSSESNITLYQVISQEITYDNTFVNNTKSYIFKNIDDSFVIFVNYSSIQVPESYADILNLTIVEQNKTISNLTLRLDNLTSQMESLNNQTISLQKNVTELENQSVDYWSNWQYEKNQNAPLRYNISVLKGDVDYYMNKTLELSNDIDTKDNRTTILYNKINEASGGWAFSVNLDGEDIYIVHWGYLLIGLFLGGFLMIYVLGKRSKQSASAKDYKGLKGKIASIFGFRAKQTIDKPYTRNTDVSIEEISEKFLDEQKNKDKNDKSKAEIFADSLMGYM